MAAAVIGVLAGCLVAACGAAPVKVTPRSGSPARSVGAGGRQPAAAAARCGGLVPVGPGVTVPPWRLGAIGFVSPRLGIALTAARKPQIRAEAGGGPAEVFLPQTHRPGDEAEVDFGEVVVWLAGEDVSCFLFCLRLSFSGKAVHRVSLPGGQEAFFEGHEHAFRVLGGCWPGRSATTTSSPRR